MYTTTPCHQCHYVREELASVLLVAIPTNVKEEANIAQGMLVSKKPMEMLVSALVFSVGMPFLS